MKESFFNKVVKAVSKTATTVGKTVGGAVVVAGKTVVNTGETVGKTVGGVVTNIVAPPKVDNGEIPYDMKPGCCNNETYDQGKCKVYSPDSTPCDTFYLNYCANNMRDEKCRTMIKTNKDGLYDKVVDEWCSTNPDDPLCACTSHHINNVASFNKNEDIDKAYRESPQCFYTKCKDQGYHNLSQWNTNGENVCSKYTICDQEVIISEDAILDNTPIILACGANPPKIIEKDQLAKEAKAKAKNANNVLGFDMNSIPPMDEIIKKITTPMPELKEFTILHVILLVIIIIFISMSMGDSNPQQFQQQYPQQFQQQYPQQFQQQYPQQFQQQYPQQYSDPYSNW